MPGNDGAGQVKTRGNVLRNAARASGPHVNPARKANSSNEANRSVHALLSRSRDDRVNAAKCGTWEDRALLWISFSYASGIAVYAMLPAEPSWQAVSVVFCAVTGLALLRSRTRGVAPLVLIVLAFCAGGAFSSIRTAYVAAPRLADEVTVDLTGFVLERADRLNGTRLLVSVETVNDRSLQDVVFPARVRVRVPAATAAVIGDKVQFRARLFPPSGPVMPGGYDFSFRAYFSQIGATGFSFGIPDVKDHGGISVRLQIAAYVQSIRDKLAARIKADLADAPEAALAVALLVGDRGAISEHQQDSLRAAGLAHILAISGLHMALFAGGTYAAFLFFLSLFPALSLRIPTHKLAAVCALMAAAFYLLISGGSIATQRSFLMIALVFLGVLTGRRGLTLRSVALAALFLLTLAPERLFYPGFQMSFAAVICLIAVYETWREQADRTNLTSVPQTGWKGRFLKSAGRWVLGLFVTALVAGVATGIIAAHHFGRVAPFGIVGNMLGMPVFSILVMPMGVLSFVLMPFGLSSLPLAVMAFGLNVLLKIAQFVAELDGGRGAIGQLTAFEMLALVAALFSVFLLRGRSRLLAAVPFALGAGLVWVSASPDVHIAASGYRIAARDAGGTLKWTGRGGSFQTESWYQAEGVPPDQIKSHKTKSPQLRCDDFGCVVKAHARPEHAQGTASPAKPLLIAAPRTPDALYQDCRYADLIVSDLIVPVNCSAPIVFDKSIRQVRGAISLWLSAETRELLTTRSGGSVADRPHEDEVRTEVVRIEFAVDESPRAWHQQGDVTRASLK